MRRVALSAPVGGDTRVGRVVTLGDLAGDWTPDLRYFVLARDDEESALVARIADAGASNVTPIRSAALAPSDVISMHGNGREAFVHHRPGDRHHSLLLTNQCNSYCLMCSQPPTPHDDAWLVDEAIDVLRHMRASPAVLGLSGGEPLLLGARLRELLAVIADLHPTTTVEVLTNGRLLSTESIVNDLLQGLRPRVRWLVPLYGHADFIHDYVVQARGAFEETLAGLLALQEHKQAVQLRIVLIKPVLQVLTELCGFIGRNLPFVQEVALIAAEPIGFALANRDICEVDLAEWGGQLSQAARVLNRHAVPYLFMNTPLCGLPQGLWRHAHRSISDWKNVYVDECAGCAVKESCSGLFAWHERGWKPTKIKAVKEGLP